MPVMFGFLGMTFFLVDPMITVRALFSAIAQFLGF